MAQQRQDVRNERGTFEAAEGADADSRDLRVAAAGGRAENGKIVRRGRATIFSLQDRQSAWLGGRCAAATKETKTPKDTNPPLRFRGHTLTSDAV